MHLKALIAGYAIAKGAIVGTVVIAVVHSTLTPFSQALIITIVSAVIGAIGMIGAAYIARLPSKEVEQANRHLVDIKQSQGLNKRATDEASSESHGSDPSS